MGKVNLKFARFAKQLDIVCLFCYNVYVHFATMDNIGSEVGIWQHRKMNI